MILFHQRLPCSENFFRYFKNYDKYMEEKQNELPVEIDDMSNESSTSQLSQLSKSPVRSIESPKYGLALSPIQMFLEQHSPRSSVQAKATMFNFDSTSQKAMLQNAAHDLKTGKLSFQQPVNQVGE